jgi:hypothetical protein
MIFLYLEPWGDIQLKKTYLPMRRDIVFEPARTQVDSPLVERKNQNVVLF